MGMEAKRLQSMRSANGTAFLIDSTLAEWHASDDANAGEEVSFSAINGFRTLFDPFVMSG